MTTMRDLGEEGFIANIKSRLPQHGSVMVGIGDDAAVTSGPETDTSWVFTSDAVISGIHVDDSLTPEQIGRKLMARNLSDLAAMGAEPCYALVNVVTPGETESDWMLGVYKGLAALAEEYNCAIIGGDTACGPGPQFHLFAIGTCPAEKAVLRSTAKPGDLLYVSGALGGSLHKGRHAMFTPRLVEARWLREQNLVTAMMDISDGLATDLPRLAMASGCGFSVDADSIPIHEDVILGEGQTPLGAALCDGEDYELLFTINAKDKEKLESGWASSFDADLHCIGQAEDGSSLTLLVNDERLPWDNKGYEHFRD